MYTRQPRALLVLAWVWVASFWAKGCNFARAAAAAAVSANGPMLKHCGLASGAGAIGVVAGAGAAGNGAAVAIVEPGGGDAAGGVCGFSTAGAGAELAGAADAGNGAGDDAAGAAPAVAVAVAVAGVTARGLAALRGSPTICNRATPSGSRSCGGAGDTGRAIHHAATPRLSAISRTMRARTSMRGF
ncbi:MAG: hypothetical protein JF591_03935 [Lysobacter sp.]|nr:hypothetical protein [Lysobacter sp.]